MESYELTLIGSEDVAEGTRAFRFAKPSGFTFAAGQYVDMSLIDPGEPDPAGNLRSFSIASAPHEDHLLFATRMRSTPFKRQLGALAPGARVRVTAAQGELLLEDDARTAVLLAGGIGITPFRSMLRDAAHRGSDRAITLIYGNRTPRTSAFMAELETIAARLPALAVVHCMSEPDKAVPAWSGECGFIGEDLIARHVGDPAEPVYYVVGPPAMTTAMRDMLMNVGVDDESVRVEEFAGY